MNPLCDLKLARDTKRFAAAVEIISTKTGLFYKQVARKVIRLARVLRNSSLRRTNLLPSVVVALNIAC